MKTVQQIADTYNVSVTAVHKWINAGLEHQYRVVKNKKPFIVLKLKDVSEWLYNRFKTKIINSASHKLGKKIDENEYIDSVLREAWNKIKEQ